MRRVLIALIVVAWPLLDRAMTEEETRLGATVVDS
jgi:hypothetical protein